MKAKSSLRAMHARRFRRALLAWFRRHGRDLPWRRTRDPYRVAVSEFMLQQTPVSRVEGYYTRFLRRFPSLDHLAAARPAAVRDAWAGLGYYRRAANLHALARVVRTEHGGEIPRDPEALLRLPGVGRYTAGAIATFAFEQSTPAVDTNVERVIRRAFHPRLGRGARAAARIWTTARFLVPEPGPPAWAFNQAIMELGALVCTAREARCTECPVVLACSTGRAVTRRRGRVPPPAARGARVPH